MNERIQFSYIMFVYQVVNGQGPSYISQIQWYAQSRTLRSANQYLLLETKVKIKTYGERTFRFLAPKLWINSNHTLRLI